MTPTHFQQQILTWFDAQGRKDLPWQQDITPYRVWLSEIMLQQTQVSTVIPYFNAFVDKFPSLDSLANATIDEVLPYWSGLGYYARARNLHKTAQFIYQQQRFPDTLAELIALAGIGQSTAGAILSIAFNKSHPILDGNVKRVLTRYKAIEGWTGDSQINKKLWAISTELTPIERCADYTQAMMDLGAILCTRSKPACADCPLTSHCLARINGTVALLPTPKPKKILPVKQVIFLLLSNDSQQIFLEKRPPTGIWGGLWSLPEFDSVESAHDWCLSKNMAIASQQLLPTSRHTFSHYHLDYTPLAIHTNSSTNFVMEANQSLWYNADHNVGLATPIKHLLQQYNSEN
ncbi:MAG: adenine DNA glycosylase [Gammaproteobacteria bacterium]|nr:adenine DNA glycosylase [Gammaproteobacteria bacterium]